MKGEGEGEGASPGQGALSPPLARRTGMARTAADTGGAYPYQARAGLPP